MQIETHRPLYFEGVVGPIFDQPPGDCLYIADQLSPSNDGPNHQSKGGPPKHRRAPTFYPSFFLGHQPSDGGIDCRYRCLCQADCRQRNDRSSSKRHRFFQMVAPGGDFFNFYLLCYPVSFIHCATLGRPIAEKPYLYDAEKAGLAGIGVGGF